MLTREAGIKPKLPASIEVRPEWALVEDIDFPTLNRLYESEEPSVVDLYAIFLSSLPGFFFPYCHDLIGTLQHLCGRDPVLQ